MPKRPAPPRLFASPEHRPFRLEAGEVGALLLHGFPGTPAEMRPLGEALRAAGISAYGPLLPGFGPNIERLGQTPWEAWVTGGRQAWQEVRERHRRAVLVGLSMGGAIALALAAREPPARLVLLAPLWRLYGLGWPLASLALVKRVMPSIAPFKRANFSDPALRRSFLRMDPGLDLDDPEVQRDLRRSATLPTAALDELRRLGLTAPGHAAQVSAPTLIVQGSLDRTVHARHTRALARRLRGPVQLEELPTGHQLLDPGGECWAVVRDLVVAFAAEAAE